MGALCQYGGPIWGAVSAELSRQPSSYALPEPDPDDPQPPEQTRKPEIEQEPCVEENIMNPIAKAKTIRVAPGSRNNRRDKYGMARLLGSQDISKNAVNAEMKK
jgi:hypothetical protein